MLIFLSAFLVLLRVHLDYHLSFLCSNSMFLDQDLRPQFYKKMMAILQSPIKYYVVRFHL